MGGVALFQGNLFALFCHQQGRIDGAVKAQTGTVCFFSYHNAINRGCAAATKDNFPLNRLPVRVYSITAQTDACFRDVTNGTGERGNRMAVIGSFDKKGIRRLIKLHAVMLAGPVGSFPIGMVCRHRPVATQPEPTEQGNHGNNATDHQDGRHIIPAMRRKAAKRCLSGP